MTDESLNLPELPDAVEAEIRHMESDGWRHIRQYLRDYALAAIALNRRTPQPDKAGECCIPDDGEPSFVLLGRDPQAPALVDSWANERERYEPTSTKSTKARVIAERMRQFKAANPDKGLATPPPPGAGEDRRDANAARYEWLRERADAVIDWDFMPDLPKGSPCPLTLGCSETLDLAIDAAMRGEGNGA